jgi:hypothetical protein
MKNNPAKDERLEEERTSLYNIFKVFNLWAQEFSKRRKKIIIYNKGQIAIMQRSLTFMSEEDAFWMLIGIVKAFNNLYSFDFKENKTLNE